MTLLFLPYCSAVGIAEDGASDSRAKELFSKLDVVSQLIDVETDDTRSNIVVASDVVRESPSSSCLSNDSERTPWKQERHV